MEDLNRIERQFRSAGFSGCKGAVDFVGWTWKKFAKPLQGLIFKKYGLPILIMKAICDLYLWVLNLQFGFLAQQRPAHFICKREILKFVFLIVPTMKRKIIVREQLFNSNYYLADGIYLSWIFFSKTLQLLSDDTQSLYCKSEESIRKIVERLFGCC